MFFRSIRFKIIALYMALILFSLLVFSAVLYHHLSVKLNDNLDDLLKLWANGVVDSIEMYWETERLEALEGGLDPRAFIKRNNINFSKIAKRWVDEKSNDPNLVNIIIQIFDADSRLIVSTKDFSGYVTEDQRPSGIKAAHNAIYEIIVSDSDSGQGVWYRAYTQPVIENKNLAYSVRVISQTSEIDSTMDYLKLLLFILLPVTVLATGAVSASLVQKTFGHVDHMVGTIRQVTEKNMALRIGMPDTRDEIKRLADSLDEMLTRLEDSFESQKKFMEDVTHELKTPLAILKGEIEAYRMGNGSLAEADSLLYSNLEEVNRLIKTVEDLLLLARFDTRAIRLERAKIDLSALVQELAEIITILTNQKRILFTPCVERGLTVMGDRQKLNRVFLNILDNAVKYTPEGGTIHLSLVANADQVIFSVRDSGCGIPQDDIGKVFQRFFRSDLAASQPGSGLGLCIARSIAEAHGGVIDVESVPTQGSAFTVTLPLH